MKKRSAALLAGISLQLFAMPGTASAQDRAAEANDSGARDSGGGVGEIVVTAQKREQNLNDVGLTIAALSGAELANRNVTDAADLTKLVAGFVYQESATGSPIYTLRGVGYVDETISATPAVSVYVDEVPLPFSVMSRGAALDLERVEVLKGPQGTLFGENSTGGAFNYVAAKPKDTFGAGTEFSLSRFGTADLQGYLTGPLGDNLSARISVRSILGGDWQRSYTRDAGLGDTEKYQGRLQLAWEPSSRLRFLASAQGWIDRSETQAPQLIAITPQNPANIQPIIANYPLPPRNNQAADWNPEDDHRRDDHFYQLSLRGELDLTDDIKLTSISAYSKVKTDAYYDNDGLAIQDTDRQALGNAKSFFQELRVSGDTGPINWIVGANYSKSRADESVFYNVLEASNSEVFPGERFTRALVTNEQRIRSMAVFGNVEFKLSDTLTLKGGARYTESKRRAVNCSADAGNGVLADSIARLAVVLAGGGTPADLGLGDCYPFDENFVSGPVRNTLDENNVSWRVGVDFKPGGGPTLLYANVSKGFKAGTVPALAAISQSQYTPVTQESLLSYEAGFKTPLFDRRVQLNGAAFYYDYRDKQLLGRILDPVFGVIMRLANIPKSRMYGAELSLNAEPVDGLRINVSGTYLDTKIQEFEGYSAQGVFQDFAGTRLPYAPKWQINSNAEYRWDVGEIQAFIGGDVSYQSDTSGGFRGDNLYYIKPRTIVDARVGIEHPADGWRFQVWGKNITNEFYWTSIGQVQDTTFRYTGRPATYGATIAMKW